MTFSRVTTAYAVLALVAYAVVALALGLWLLARVSGTWRRRGAALTARMTPAAPGLGWMVAALAMFGSLYLSEVVHLVPCKLCWYQRICMYPLVVLLAIAWLRRDLVTARRYAVPLALIGALVSAYHYQLERFPGQPTLSCGLDVPCSVPVVNVWGFASVPFMALAAFLLVATVLLAARPDAVEDVPDQARPVPQGTTSNVPVIAASVRPGM